MFISLHQSRFFWAVLHVWIQDNAQNLLDCGIHIWIWDSPAGSGTVGRYVTILLELHSAKSQ